MNASRKILAAVTLLAMLGAARADDPTPDPYQDWTPTRSRAEVIAELRADAAEARVALGEDSGSFALAQQAPRSLLARAQVVAELRTAQRLIASLIGEDSGSFHFTEQGWIPSAPRGVRYARAPR
jgi:hypothetical protein